MTGEQKIEYIHSQILQIRAGLLSFITCPYCGTENTPADVHVCCKMFGEASMAILDRMEKQAAIDFLNTVADKVH